MAFSDKDLEEMAGTLHTAIATGEGSALENEAIAEADDLINGYKTLRDLVAELTDAVDYGGNSSGHAETEAYLEDLIARGRAASSTEEEEQSDGSR